MLPASIAAVQLDGALRTRQNKISSLELLVARRCRRAGFDGCGRRWADDWNLSRPLRLLRLDLLHLLDLSELPDLLGPSSLNKQLI